MRKWTAALLFLAAASAWADESPWQKSYRLEATGKYAEAAAALDGASGGDADLALMRRGWLAYLQGRYNEAMDFYGRASKMNPKSLEAQLGITLPLMAQQRWREAASHARQVIAESSWDYTAHLRLMIAEEGLRDWKSLAEHAERVSEHYPADATTLVYLARAQAWMGNTKAAKETYGPCLSG